ncbi:MAG: fibronectin type III domain-containing protein, partial [Psychrosphaera sp.]|nr:fibronectin type III domain-containing protein [Psychrosphaera sp.]
MANNTFGLKTSMYRLNALKLMQSFKFNLENEGQNHKPTKPQLTLSKTDIKSAEQITVTANSTDVDGDPLTYSFKFGSGELVSQSGNVATWKAPTTDSRFDVALTVSVSDGQGGAVSQSLTIVVNGGDDSGTTSAVLTPNYSSSNNTFALAYQLTNTTTFVQIDHAYDNANWSKTFNRNVISQYWGNKTATVDDSELHSVIYFRIGTKSAGSDVLNWLPSQRVDYTPPPVYEEKSTELPVAPKLYGVGSTVTRDSLDLSWRKVIDSKNNDNANYYEIASATRSSFSDQQIIRAPNTATGSNMYESISYLLTDLQDESRYYFKVRAVNNLGEGAWSNVENIKVDVQDLPYFTSDISPSEGQTSVGKLPKLCWAAQDDDGDDLEFYLKWGEDPNSLSKSNSFNEGQTCHDFAVEDESELKPNTRYYWQVKVREDGYYKDYYGG